MGLYDKYILPKFLDLAMRQRPIMRQRGKVVPQATGRVLEIGLGSGLNLSYYNQDTVSDLSGLEPSEELRVLARGRSAQCGMDVKFIGLRGEDIPSDDESFDSIVVTYTLCTIPNVKKALSEMRRVLKPKGALLFCEHGRAPDTSVAKWQDRINPFWKKVSGGCNLNRPVNEML